MKMQFAATTWQATPPSVWQAFCDASSICFCAHHSAGAFTAFVHRTFNYARAEWGWESHVRFRWKFTSALTSSTKSIHLAPIQMQNQQNCFIFFSFQNWILLEISKPFVTTRRSMSSLHQSRERVQRTRDDYQMIHNNEKLNDSSMPEQEHTTSYNIWTVLNTLIRHSKITLNDECLGSSDIIAFVIAGVCGIHWPNGGFTIKYLPLQRLFACASPMRFRWFSTHNQIH